MNDLLKWIITRSLWHKAGDIVFAAVLFMGLTVGYEHLKQMSHRIGNKDYNRIINEGIEVKRLLGSIREITGSEVVILYRYHNGTVGVNGFSFIKKTASNLNKAPYYRYDYINDRDIPLTSDIDQLKSHLNGKCTAEQVNTGLQLYPLYQARGFKTIATCPVFDFNKLLIGHILIGFTSKTNINAEELKMNLNPITNQIGRL